MWILLVPALGLALGQNYPTNLTFERWTTPEGELLQLEGGNRTSRTYRVTALSRLDPQRPGFMLQPLYNGNTTVRTYDQKVPLSSLQETPVRVYYESTWVAYLKLDYSHSGVRDVWLYWDNQLLYAKSGSNYGNLLWGTLWTVSFGTISLFWIPSGSGEYHTTIPIPLDDRVHVLQFGGGGDCFAARDWNGFYKVRSDLMQPGKIYWVQARNGCGGLGTGINGGLTQMVNPVRVDYQTTGLPPVVRIGEPGWYDPQGVVGAVQFTNGSYPSLTGVGGYPDNGSSYSFGERGILVPASGDLDHAATIPYTNPYSSWFTVSRRYEVNENRDSGVSTYGNQLNQFILTYCGGWEYIETNPNVNSAGRWACTGGTTQATFRLTGASWPDPLRIYMDPALDGTVTTRTVVNSDSQGRPVSSTVYEAHPAWVTRTYTMHDVFRCVSGSCP